jgi:NADH-quinone oxidoreductase subunit J
VEIALFYIAATIALVSTFLVLTKYNASHALIYLIISLLAAAVIFYVVGAPFAAVLEILVYAGAIMVLFIFVVMMLNLGQKGVDQEHEWFNVKMWIFPSILALILLAEVVYVLAGGSVLLPGDGIGPKAVGMSLFGPYVLAVEIASMLLLAGLVGAYQLGRRYLEENREEDNQ